MTPLWKITGIGRSGKPVVVMIRATDYGAALERFRQRHFNVRIISIVKQEG